MQSSCVLSLSSGLNASQPHKGQVTAPRAGGNGRDVQWMDQIASINTIDITREPHSIGVGDDVERIASIDTIDIFPLSQAEFVRWEATQSQMNSRRLSASTVEGTIQQITETGDALSAPGQTSESSSGAPGGDNSEIGISLLSQRFRQRITGILPV